MPHQRANSCSHYASIRRRDTALVPSTTAVAEEIRVPFRLRARPDRSPVKPHFVTATRSVDLKSEMKNPDGFRHRGFGIKAWQCPTFAWGDPTLSSALSVFTSEFGKGSGGSRSLWPPGNSFTAASLSRCGGIRERSRAKGMLQGLEPAHPAFWVLYGQAARAISTG